MIQHLLRIRTALSERVGSGVSMRRSYHIFPEDHLRSLGFSKVFSGEGGYEDAKTDLEVSTVMMESRRAPDGRSFEEIRFMVFEKQQEQRNQKPYRTGLNYLTRQLRGREIAHYYPMDPFRNPHNPFPLNPKQERWKARVETLTAKGKGPKKTLKKPPEERQDGFWNF